MKPFLLVVFVLAALNIMQVTIIMEKQLEISSVRSQRDSVLADFKSLHQSFCTMEEANARLTGVIRTVTISAYGAAMSGTEPQSPDPDCAKKAAGR